VEDREAHILLKSQSLCKLGQNISSAPNGISISSAIPSIPMKVKATIVTTGIVIHPRSLTRVKGSEKRYNVTHCFKCIPSSEFRSKLKRRNKHNAYKEKVSGYLQLAPYLSSGLPCFARCNIIIRTRPEGVTGEHTVEPCRLLQQDR
jgi:hypothetical protein